MTTRAAARTAATARLRAAGDATAGLDADLLLAHACALAKEALYAHLDEPLAPSEEAAFAGLVARRAAGEPVAYLRGYKEFFGLRFAVDARVLIPRPETEVLVEALLLYLHESGRTRVADVGTGSGAIAVAVAVHAPAARVVATDVSAGALEVARANAFAHGVAGRVETRQGDLLDPLDAPVDAVAANLPYLRADAVEHLTGERTSLAFEPRGAVVAGPDGLAIVRRCVAQLPRVLAPGGAAFFECDPPQAEAVARMLEEALGASARVIPDLTGGARVAAARTP